MRRYQTPGYYNFIESLGEYRPSNCVEGRLFLDDEKLLCGAGDHGGYGDTTDQYSGSILRRFFGKKHNPQRFEYDTARSRHNSVAISLDSVTDIKIVKWNKSELNRARDTYGVLLIDTSMAKNGLMLQLGEGKQNQGTGKNRHVALATAVTNRSSGLHPTGIDTEENSNTVSSTNSSERSSPDSSQTPTATRTAETDSESGSVDQSPRTKQQTEPGSMDDKRRDTAQNSESNSAQESHTETETGTQADSSNVATGVRDDDTDTATTHPVTEISEEITSDTRVSDPLAAELCRALSANSPDRERIESALSDVIDRLEHADAVADVVAGFEKSTDERQIESMRRSLAALDGPIANGMEPALDRLHDVETELETHDPNVTSRPDRGQDHREKIDELQSEIDQYQQRYDRLETAAGVVCRDATQGAISFRSSDTDERLVELADALETGDIVFDTPGRPLATIVKDVKRSVRPQTPQSRDLLGAVGESDWADDEISAVIKSTVTTVDRFAELQAAVADIQISDVRRRLDSLDSELEHKEDPVYRHLADRVRELEVMVEEGIDDVQLYAIYQECTFYDRTLVPRLSRSNGFQNVDVPARVREVDDRITSINDEYVSVKVDYNHTIPNHFLNLANALCDQARQIGDQHPQRAVGQLAAASELLDHVEELYERTEYSVMLRRLRG